VPSTCQCKSCRRSIARVVRERHTCRVWPRSYRMKLRSRHIGSDSQVLGLNTRAEEVADIGCDPLGPVPVSIRLEEGGLGRCNTIEEFRREPRPEMLDQPCLADGVTAESADAVRDPQTGARLVACTEASQTVDRVPIQGERTVCAGHHSYRQRLA